MFAVLTFSFFPRVNKLASLIVHLEQGSEREEGGDDLESDMEDGEDGRVEVEEGVARTHARADTHKHKRSRRLDALKRHGADGAELLAAVLLLDRLQAGLR